MSCEKKVQSRDSEKGVALLLAIFALLILSVIGLALILGSGTESSLAANYRTSTQAYYAGQAGLEEARGRLWSRSPNVFAAAFVPQPSANTVPPFLVLPVGQVRYVLNPAPGETNATVNPLGATYPDLEYGTEFTPTRTPGPPAAAALQTTNSIWVPPPVAGIPGPMYKWVRINAVTEQMLGYDVDNNGILDNALPLYYEFNNTPGINRPTLTLVPPTAGSQESQALEVTALAVMPNGARRLLQYLVAPVVFNLSFPSALTLDGQSDTYFPANSNVFWMNGIDQSRGGTCTQVAAPVPAIGVPDNDDVNRVTNTIPANRTTNYVGSTPAPSVANVSSTTPTNLQTVDSLDGSNGVVEQIRNAADYVVTPSVPGTPVTSLPDMGSASAPVVTVVDGDFSLSGTNTGYGILVVTGNFSFSGNSGWRGIVLVIGQGTMTEQGGGNNSFDGAVLLANTRSSCATNDSQCSLRNNLGGVVLNWAGGGGDGIYFNSCWINNVQNQASYRVLSFREIAQ